MLKIRDFFIKIWVCISVIIMTIIIYNILSFIFVRGIKAINIDFFVKNPMGMPLGTEGGVKGAIIGSICTMILSIIISIILGGSCAFYNTIFCKNKYIKIFINFAVQTVSSIPSIIIGLFVYVFFIVTLNINKSMLTVGIALGIMTFSFVEKSLERVILTIENKIIRESRALGVDRDYMCIKLLIPIMKKELISTSILAGSYAIGATAPIILTGAVFTGGNSNKLFSPVMSLPFHLHILLGQGIDNERAYGTALVLIFILLILHIISDIVINGIGGKIVECIRIKKC